MMHGRPTLRQLLTIPYVVLVLLAAVLIGLLSYRAGEEAVDTLSDLMLNETVGRIVQAVDQHISGSEAVLETAFPTDVSAPESIADDLERLRERLWLATTIHRDPNNYAYYGNRDGQFIGLFRHSAADAELRLRTDEKSNRSIYSFSRINGELGKPVVESRVFDPRNRPWFEAGQSTEKQTWTEIYIDFKTLELVGTRARRVNGLDGEFEGVVATDMSLRHLDDFLDKLTLSENGVAFIVENDGKLLATSRGPHLLEGDGEEERRLNAVDSHDPLVVATHEAVRGFINEGEAFGTGAFEGPDGGTVQAGFARLQDTAGLDWIVAVATPRADFMGAVTRNVRRTALMSVIACTLIVMLGLYILNRIARELRQLGQTAQRIGDGDLSASVPIERDDEIGELARAFSDLQKRLLTDRLTGIANREAMVQRLENRLLHNRRARDERPFALLFLDLDHFKSINDQFGHDVGDHVLCEVSERIVRTIRERDLVARFGGDEFVVLLDEVKNRNDALAIAEKLQYAIGSPYEAIMEVAGRVLQQTGGVSIGLAMYPEDGQDVESLLRQADAGMYEKKGASRQQASLARQ